MNNVLAIMAAALVIYCICEGIARIVRVARTTGGSKQAQQRVEDLEADMEALEQDLEDARKRIEVLEQIVTDEKYNLNKAIDDLASN